MDSSKIVKAVLLITIAVLFLITSIMALTSASRIGAETVKTYVLKVESCDYKPIARPVAGELEKTETEEVCKVDYNRAKEVIVDSTALLIISLPIALFTYRKLFRLYRD